jgi:[acyl-carrier-protein] S-malonyltransferase
VDLAKSRGAKRAVMLPVSAPFHCVLMQPAAERMQAALSEVAILPPAMPLVSNVSAQGETDPERMRDLLVRQVTSSVRWRESVIWMSQKGTTTFWEVGAGKALSGMVRRIVRDAETRAVSTPSDVATVAREIA